MYASARIAAYTGENEHATQAAARAVQSLQQADLQPVPASRMAPFLPGLARLLFELNLAGEAAQAAQLAVEASPNDYQMLSLMGEALKQAGKLDQAIPRPYGSFPCSRKAGAARKISGAAGKCWEVGAGPIGTDRSGQPAQPSKSNEGEDTSRDLEPEASTESQVTKHCNLVTDLRLLANCAVHAGQPEQAIEVCTKSWPWR